MTEANQIFDGRPAAGSGRPLAVAVLWAYAVALAGGAIVGLAAVLAGMVMGVVWIFDRSTSIVGPMTETLTIAAWVCAPIGLVIAIWVAAYGSTREGSVPRTLVAAPAALAVAVGLLLLDSSGLLAAALALGWALAVPAGGPTRVAGRAVPLLIVALLLPELSTLEPWQAAIYLGAAPPLAALAVYASDRLWAILDRRRPAEG